MTSSILRLTNSDGTVQAFRLNLKTDKDEVAADIFAKVGPVLQSLYDQGLLSVQGGNVHFKNTGVITIKSKHGARSRHDEIDTTQLTDTPSQTTHDTFFTALRTHNRELKFDLNPNGSAGKANEAAKKKAENGFWKKAKDFAVKPWTVFDQTVTNMQPLQASANTTFPEWTNKTMTHLSWALGKLSSFDAKLAQINKDYIQHTLGTPVALAVRFAVELIATATIVCAVAIELIFEVSIKAVIKAGSGIKDGSKRLFTRAPNEDVEALRRERDALRAQVDAFHTPHASTEALA